MVFCQKKKLAFSCNNSRGIQKSSQKIKCWDTCGFFAGLKFFLCHWEFGVFCCFSLSSDLINENVGEYLTKD